jgi:hypothetical protein
MPTQTADVIDLQAYRKSRSQAHTEGAPRIAYMAPFAMQPVFMWVPLWGFMPVMTVGLTGYGV